MIKGLKIILIFRFYLNSLQVQKNKKVLKLKKKSITDHLINKRYQ